MNSSIDLNTTSGGVPKVNNDEKLGYEKRKDKSKTEQFHKIQQQQISKYLNWKCAPKNDREMNSRKQCDIKGCTGECCT